MKPEVFIRCEDDVYYKGWIFKLFPYLNDGRNSLGNKQYKQNHLVLNIEPKKYHPFEMLEFSDFPDGLSKVDIKLNRFGEETLINFYSRIIGAKQNPKTLSLCPSIQWFVVDTGEVLG